MNSALGGGLLLALHSPLDLLDHLFWGEIAVMFEGTQTALRKCLHGEELRPPAHSHVSEQAIWKHFLQPHSSFQMGVPPLTSFLQPQNHPTQPLLKSRPTDTVTDSKYLLFLVTKFCVICDYGNTVTHSSVGFQEHKSRSTVELQAEVLSFLSKKH